MAAQDTTADISTTAVDIRRLDEAMRIQRIAYGNLEADSRALLGMPILLDYRRSYATIYLHAVGEKQQTEALLAMKWVEQEMGKLLNLNIAK